VDSSKVLIWPENATTGTSAKDSLHVVNIEHTKDGGIILFTETFKESAIKYIKEQPYF